MITPVLKKILLKNNVYVLQAYYYMIIYSHRDKGDKIMEKTYTLFWREAYFENGKKTSGFYCSKEFSNREELEAYAKRIMFQNSSFKTYDFWYRNEQDLNEEYRYNEELNEFVEE